MSLLIVTDSRDYTTDLIVQRLDRVADRVFRFNLDLIDSYRLHCTPTRFQVCDPKGRVSDSDSVTKFYWRKPIARSRAQDADVYLEAELWQVVKSMFRLCWDQQKIVLVEPLCESTRLDKLRQLRIAQACFTTPSSSVVFGQQSPELPSEVIVKSLSGETVGNKRLFTKRVEQRELSSQHLWFMQSVATARYDLTVVCVRDKQFAFAFDRKPLGTEVDWRIKAHHHEMMHWEQVTLPDSIRKAVAAFMQSAGLHFGRLDFLWDGKESAIFCEVNPNGQFAWLDLDGSRGVLDAVVDAVSPSTQTVPIPQLAHVERT